MATSMAASQTLATRPGVRLLASEPGGLIALADLDGGLKMLADRQEIWSLPPLDDDAKTNSVARITDIAFDLDGEVMVVVGSHGVSAYKPRTGEILWTHKRRWVFGLLADLPLTVSRGPQTDFLVSWSSGRFERLDREGNKKRAWSDHSAPESMVFLTNSSVLVGADGYSLRSLDATVWPPIERASLIGRWVKVIEVPRHEMVIARRLEMTCGLRASDLSEVWTVPGPTAHPALATSPDGERVAWVDDGDVVVSFATDGLEESRHSFPSRALSVAIDDAGILVGLADGSLATL